MAKTVLWMAGKCYTVRWDVITKKRKVADWPEGDGPKSKDEFDHYCWSIRARRGIRSA
jgi:hypothetical protein